MRDNPINIAVFGSDDTGRQRALAPFFEMALQGLERRGLILGAFADSAMLGVCGIAPPGQCQPVTTEKLRMVPVLLKARSIATVVRTAHWVGEWARRDPPTVHWHLGPVAVAANAQRSGIGGALVSEFCTRVDAAGAVAYLETDKRENIRFYERHGFSVTSESVVLKVTNWFMTRPASVEKR